MINVAQSTWQRECISKAIAHCDDFGYRQVEKMKNQSIYLQKKEIRIIEMKNVKRHEIPEGSTHSILTVDELGKK